MDCLRCLGKIHSGKIEYCNNGSYCRHCFNFLHRYGCEYCFIRK